MNSVTLLLKAKKMLWFIYDLLTLSKTEIFSAPTSLVMKNKSQNKSGLSASQSFPVQMTFQN
jgi:hypothetical protein